MAGSAIQINNELDPTTKLYDPQGNLVGEIKNNTAMCDVCVQIARNKLSGYYVMFNEQKVTIEADGRIRNPPEGFYDAEDKIMRELVGF